MKSMLIGTVLLLAIGCQDGKSPLLPSKLTCDYVKNPSVVDRLQPRLAWVNAAEGDFRGQRQTAYQVRVSSKKELADSADLWDSGKVDSDQSNGIIYGGVPLHSRQDCWWQVRIWDKDGAISGWSEPGNWSMGLLEQSAWQAVWIGAPWQGEEALPELDWPNAPVEEWPPPSPYFRKDFNITKEISSAKAYVTGLGYFEFYVNGAKQGDEVLVPNQTNYGKRDYLLKTNIPIPDDFQEYKIMYLAYDITNQLVQGKNTLGAILGNGFYNASKYWSGSYGSPRFIGQVHITYTDGTKETIASDESWKTSQGPILMDMVYYGETYDARLEQLGWSEPVFDDSGWASVTIREKPFGKLVAHTPYPDKITEQLEPVSIQKLENGNYYINFGVEISGWVRLNNLNGPEGHQIDIKFISNTPSGDNTYILSGKGDESYAPRFNWFVFSAVEIINWPGELNKKDIIAEAVNTYIEETAHFETSNALFNDINRIWKRSQLDNMHGGIASDCPHRERSPYTGDGQVAAATVMHNFDARSFYDKWIADIRGAQIVSTGYVPNCAPWEPGCGGGVAWGAAMCIIPWEFYLHYGALDVLGDNYTAMKGYVAYMKTWLDKDGIMFSERTGKDGKILKWFNLGEWGCIDGKCPPDEMVHTFFFWRCAQITAMAAKALGNEKESRIYAELYEQTRTAFHKRFYNEPKGTYGKNGANVFALEMGVSEEHRARVIAALKQSFKENDGHWDTGIFGTQLLFEVLSENGLHEIAYNALNKKTEPSFGFWLANGATTTREFWNNEGSHNHPMFGGGLTWFYRKLAGMQTDHENPGYKHIVFKPHLIDEMSFVKYFNETSYGTAGISWEKDSDGFHMNVTVPVGSTATVYVPARSDQDVMESGGPVTGSEYIDFIGLEEGYVVYKVESGEYKFSNTKL